MHARAPNIPFLMGAGGSARKSSMTDYGTDLLTTNAAAPDEFKQRQFLAQDSTLRGIYDSIIATGSCGIVSDEASCTYETPDSDQGNGVHYLSQPKMCKIVNAEALDALTGKGSTHLTEYRTLHKVRGQVEAVEHIMIPRVHCFQKRMDFLIAPDETPSNELQLCADSRKMFEDLMTWLFQKADTEKLIKYLERHALTFFRTVLKAVKDWMMQPSVCKEIDPWLKKKLGYADTDLLRNANVSQRFVHFFLQRSCCPERLHADPAVIDVFHLIYGVHAWLRQIRIHSAFYKWYELTRVQVGARTGRALYDVFEGEQGDGVETL